MTTNERRFGELAVDEIDVDEGRFQKHGSLSDDEYSALAQDVSVHGVEKPVVLDEDGTVLDGHHRVEAAREHDVEMIPVDQRTALDDDDKHDLAWKLNAQRRHEDEATKRAKIEDLFLDLHEREVYKSNVEIAELLGVNDSWVGKVKKDLDDSVLDEYDAMSPQESNKREVREYVAEHPDMSNREVAKNVDASRSSVNRIVRACEQADDDIESLRSNPDEHDAVPTAAMVAQIKDAYDLSNTGVADEIGVSGRTVGTMLEPQRWPDAIDAGDMNVLGVNSAMRLRRVIDNSNETDLETHGAEALALAAECEISQREIEKLSGNIVGALSARVERASNEAADDAGTESSSDDGEPSDEEKADFAEAAAVQQTTAEQAKSAASADQTPDAAQDTDADVDDDSDDVSTVSEQAGIDADLSREELEDMSNDDLVDYALALQEMV